MFGIRPQDQSVNPDQGVRAKYETVRGVQYGQESPENTVAKARRHQEVPAAEKCIQELELSVPP